jgi:CheY-like chemotaxis protein
LPQGIEADEKRLRQVLINLLSNAIKFTDQGSVTFKVDCVDASDGGDAARQGIRFSVVDTGVGMSADQVEKIFLPFEQVGQSAKKSEGTGLGLAISQKIMLLMDSTIEVESQADQGSQFGFTIVVPETKSWAVAQPTLLNHANIMGYEGKKLTLLIADDRWENRSVIRNLLEPLNFDILEAEDGVEAWEKLTNLKPDILITDLSMPGLDGLQLLRRMRRIPSMQNMVAIASSAHVFATDQNQCLEAGASAFLAKPIQSEELLQLLQTQLQLTWIYDQPVAAATTTGKSRTTIDPANLAPPSPDNLELLRDLAMSGRLQLLKQKVRDLTQADQCSADFAAVIEQLADQFEVEKIQLLIEHCSTTTAVETPIETSTTVL